MIQMLLVTILNQASVKKESLLGKLDRISNVKGIINLVQDSTIIK